MNVTNSAGSCPAILADGASIHRAKPTGPLSRPDRIGTSSFPIAGPLQDFLFDDRFWPLRVTRRYDRSWPTAAVPHLRRKLPLEMRGCSRERRLTGFVANSHYRPTPAIHASKQSRRERQVSKWSRHSSPSQERRRISITDRQGSAASANMNR